MNKIVRPVLAALSANGLTHSALQTPCQESSGSTTSSDNIQVIKHVFTKYLQKICGLSWH